MEIIFEIVFARIIVGFFGYYTLWTVFKLTRYKKGLVWLKEGTKSEMEDFSSGCLIAIVGLISFCLIFLAIGYSYDYFFRTQ